MNNKGSKRSTGKKRVPNRARKQKLPPGWDEQRVGQLIAHYENQSEDEAVAEDEAAYRSADHAMMSVPTKLVPEVLRLIARHQQTV